jgi:two-component system CheB/CheR fusion protein
LAGQDEAALLAVVVELVHQATQVDLSDYKDSTFRRQLQRRMHTLNCATLDDYIVRLQADVEELRLLQRSLMVSVTRFFRDPVVFTAVAQVLRDLVASKADGEELRLWVPGCATGEEAYSLAMLTKEALGERWGRVPVRIFATDLDADAIAFARLGQYADEALQGLPPDLAERHLHRGAEGWRVDRDVRELCVFAQHNLLTQPTFLQLDLISCRNLLIYFQAPVQADVLTRFHQSLRPQGWLLLGQAENVGARADLFDVHDIACHLYRRNPVKPGWPQNVALARAWSRPSLPSSSYERAAARPDALAEPTPLATRLQRLLLQRDARPSVVVGPQGQVLQTWGALDRFLSLGLGGDASLPALCPPELREDARTLLMLAAQADPAEVRSTARPLTLEGRATRVRLRAQKLPGGDLGEPAVVLSFEELPLTGADAQPAAEAAVADLHDDLTLAREQTLALVRQCEHLELERQALHAELQTSNEELQSSNEELQASNEELCTLNEQLVAKSDELGALNDLLLNIEHSVQLAMVVVDPQLCVQRFNPLAVRIFGLLEDDIGRPLVSVPTNLPLDDLPRLLGHVLRTREPQLTRIDQGERHYVMQVSPLLDPNGLLTGAIVGFTDVAELRQAETERARLAAIVTHSLDAIVGKTLDGVITSWNPAAERLFGYTAQEALGQPMLMVFPPELQGEEPVLLARVGRGESVPPFDTVRLHKDGRLIHVSVTLSPIRNAEGRIIGVSKIARDITDRVADEAVRTANMARLEQLVHERTRALGEKEQQLKSILEGMPGLVAYYSADLVLRYANHEHRTRLIYNDTIENGGVGKLLPDLIGPERMAIVRPHVERVLQGQPSEFDVGPVQAPGREAHSYFNVQYVPDWRDGRVVGFIAMGFDITSVKTAEVAAAAASRAKSEFLANMSHEIRTPLNAVLGLAQVAQRQHHGQPVADTFAHILQAGQHLLGVINDVLDFSKIEAGKLELQMGRVDVTELLQRAVNMVSGQARAKGLSLRVSRDPTLPEAYAGDPIRIAQLLINLLTNAVKFTDAGKVELVLRAQDGGLAVSVSDTGPGMSAEVQSRLFQPFEQGDGSITRKVGGTGLGLSICKRLVDLMQGHIQVHSEPGEGAVFNVWLPLQPVYTAHVVEPAGHHVAAAYAGHGEPRLRGARVLVAEDHPINQMVLQQLLDAEGAIATMVVNGQLAIDALRAARQAGAEPFDLVLCDVEMPVMDGYEATRRLRELAPELPVIGLTAHAFDDARQRGEAAGMTAYLTKPYMVEELVQTVCRLVPRLAKGADQTADSGKALAAAADIPPGFRLDRDALQAHYRTVPGFIPKLLQAVRQTCAEQPELLDAALAAGQAERLRQLAHGVMGVAANLLLPGLRAQAQELELAALTDWPRAAQLVVDLKQGLERLLAQLDSP